ncbi:cytochrome-c mitochondrial import factor CYC2 [Ophiocordyceps camponoti-floridani]|uniref:Cytochrome-c mitochondrial import factor CYC2 n=1 Tax=Ophiocordyceps camponoti-floridani TaxID=2030778 RepID=A0A8H4Q619_9HYPO|nr:cytochrome-c mitochondrial import factor CYC2 [Ophiocordyceps camponoti-floridani]
MGPVPGQKIRPLPRAVSSRPPRSSRAAGAATVVLAAAAAAASTTAYYHYNDDDDATTTLNRDSFTRCVVTRKDPVSPSSSILTVSAPPTSLRGLWSVEFKQPEVQIARHYTPLPPYDDDDGRLLRFYIRSLPRGEMSSYLDRLRPGHHLWLRGPHPGFDVLRRLGSCKRLVFLAGGTGLAPAMQAASTVLEHDDDPNTSATLLWAVRQHQEIQASAYTPPPWWKLWLRRPSPIDLDAHVEDATPIALQLRRMKNKYGPRLNIRIAIHSDGSAFQTHDIEQALLRPSSSDRSTPTSNSRGCQCHNQSLHASASEFQPPNDACQCQSTADAGKNILIVSGSDGFVSHYAGPKVWARGLLTQGPVGGLVADLQRRHPSLARDWLVLKL